MAIFKGHGVVWDAEKDKPLVRFVNGELEVKDPGIAAKLASMGYPYTGDLPEVPKAPKKPKQASK